MKLIEKGIDIKVSFRPGECNLSQKEKDIINGCLEIINEVESKLTEGVKP